jgi:ComF family protein
LPGLVGGAVFKDATTVIPKGQNFPKLLPEAVRILAEPILSLLLPCTCRICQQPMELLSRVPVCRQCWEAVRAYEGAECAQCGMFLERAALLHGTALCALCRRGAFGFDQARSFGCYDGALRDIVALFKYQGIRPLENLLGAYLAQTLGRFNTGSFDLILPVPLHRNRERQRGFNQAGLLAARIGKLRGIAVAGRDCVRVRDTRPQTGLRRAERRKNVKGAFAVPHPERIRGLRVLLVDDVLTTGATADSCARALMDAGAKGVWVLTLARARAASADVI